MPLSENEVKAICAEIQRVSSTQKMLVRPTLQYLLDILSSSSVVSPADLLHGYLAHIKAADGVVKVL